MNLLKLWLTPKEAAVVLGTTADSITRDIREKQFPFKFERQGRRIKICARSIGLIVGTRNDEALENQVVSLPAQTAA